MTRCLAALCLILFAAPAFARTLTVCADPNNLPFSNERREGFENRIAAVVRMSRVSSIGVSGYAGTAEDAAGDDAPPAPRRLR